MTGAQWRKLACSLPEAEEKSHFGHPDFRVRNKIFAGMSPDGKVGSLKLPPEFQAMLLDSKPTVFSPAAGAWGRQGWTYVELPKLDAAMARELLRTSWSLVAPKKLIAAQSGAPASAKQPSAQKSAPAKRPRAANAAKSKRRAAS
jgi:hypothetical protein